MSILVDTSVWSLALRRDGVITSPHVTRLATGLRDGEALFVTGLILQELLQGLAGPRAKEAILIQFQNLPVLTPTLDDHIAAAELRNSARRRGVQVGTIDALLAQIVIRHDFSILSADRDFERLSALSPLRVVSV